MKGGVLGALLALLPIALSAQQAGWKEVKDQTASGTVRLHVIHEVRQQSRPFRQGELQKRLGTGFFITKDLMVTNQHVVDGARTIKIEGIATKEKFAVRLAAIPSLKFDLAILKFVSNAERTRFERVNGPIVPLQWAEWREAQPGERVAVLGFGFSDQLVATQGIISNWEARYANFERRLNHVTLIRTDAAVNPGNSGGPVVSPQGRVIGISARYGPGENVGLLIPFVTAKRVVAAMQKVGMFMEADPGIVAYNLNPVLRKTLKLSSDQVGMVVSHVVPSSPAARAGLRQWDVITGVSGYPVVHGEIKHAHAGPLPYWFLFNTATPGTPVAFDVLRAGMQRKVMLVMTPTSMPMTRVPTADADYQPEWGYLGGMIIAEVTQELLQEIEQTGSWRWDLVNDAPNSSKIYVVANVEPGTQAMSYQEYGLDLRQSRILSIDGRPVDGVLSTMLDRIYQAVEERRAPRTITVEFERNITIQLDTTRLANDMQALQHRYPALGRLVRTSSASQKTSWRGGYGGGLHRWLQPSHGQAAAEDGACQRQRIEPSGPSGPNQERREASAPNEC